MAPGVALCGVAQWAPLEGLRASRKQFGNIAVNILEAITFKFAELNANLEFVPGDTAHVYDVSICNYRDGLVCDDRHGEAGFELNPVARCRCLHVWNQLFDGFLITGKHYA